MKDAYTDIGRKYRDEAPADFDAFRQHYRKNTGSYGTLADYGAFRAMHYRSERENEARRDRMRALMAN